MSQGVIYDVGDSHHYKWQFHTERLMFSVVINLSGCVVCVGSVYFVFVRMCKSPAVSVAPCATAWQVLSSISSRLPLDTSCDKQDYDSGC